MEFWNHRRQQASRTAATAMAGPPDGREAYLAGLAEGRREERRRRRGHPIIAALVALVAVAGAAALALAAHEGSFARGGQVVDNSIAAAADQTKAAGQTAVVQTGQAIQDAGATLQQKVAGTNPSPPGPSAGSSAR